MFKKNDLLKIEKLQNEANELVLIEDVQSNAKKQKEYGVFYEKWLMH